MKKIGKIVSLLAVTAVLAAMVAVVPVSAAEQLYFTANVTASYEDGGYWATDVTATAEGTHGFILAGGGTLRCIWAFPDALIESHPYLCFKLSNPEVCQKITLCKSFASNPELPVASVEGEQCVNVLTAVQDQEPNGYTYVAVYTSENEQLHVEYMYLSDEAAAATGGNNNNTDNNTNNDNTNSNTGTGVSTAVGAAVAAVMGAAALIVLSKKK